MPQPAPEALDFLLSRRSRPAKTLKGPAPSGSEIETLLTAAGRTPDHGKLEPWRFIVFEEAALRRLGLEIRLEAESRGMDDEAITKAVRIYETSPLAIAVIESPVESPKIPRVEQTYSAGAVCLAMLNAALAMGWGANWLSGWPSHDMPTLFGAQPGECIAGLIHIGTETSTPPDRPRPDIVAKTTWVTS